MSITSEAEKSRQQMLADYKEQFERSDPNEFSVGSVCFHVANHTSYVCLDTVSRHLLENMTIMSHPDLYELAYQAHETLFALYQKFGEKLATETN